MWPSHTNFVNCLFSATGDSVACVTSLKTIHSFCSLSYERSIASFKASSSQNAI